MKLVKCAYRECNLGAYASEPWEPGKLVFCTRLHREAAERYPAKEYVNSIELLKPGKEKPASVGDLRREGCKVLLTSKEYHKCNLYSREGWVCTRKVGHEGPCAMVIEVAESFDAAKVSDQIISVHKESLGSDLVLRILVLSVIGASLGWFWNCAWYLFKIYANIH